MASTTSSTPSGGQQAFGARQDYELTVNAYDRTATMIISLLVMVGMTVLGLLIVYFAKKTFPTKEPIPVVPREASSPNANQGIAEEPDPPGMEEAPELDEPQLLDTLDAISEAASAKEVLLSDQVINAGAEASKGQGLGDKRSFGPGGDGVVERVPRWERWKIRFEPESEQEFAQWLDFYKIEIGVLGRDNLVHYAGNLSTGSPKVYEGEPKKEVRGYTTAADGPMPRLTMELARNADIARHGSIVLLFYPFEGVEDLLWTIEEEYSGGRDVNTIRQTVFTVLRDGGGYKFEVIDQKYF
jgi:hypothetical protein